MEPAVLMLRGFNAFEVFNFYLIALERIQAEKRLGTKNLRRCADSSGYSDPSAAFKVALGRMAAATFSGSGR